MYDKYIFNIIYIKFTTWKFLDATVFKANSCEKFEAKISEKSEKKGSKFLK